MKVGTLAYATNQGLGILVKSFVDHGVVTDVLVINHGGRACNKDWYPTSPRCSANDEGMAQEFVSQMDVMLFFETPFMWPLIPYCKKRGIRTFLMPMYECMPRKLPYWPDKFICPSRLDQQYYPDRSTFIPIPVEVPWKQRARAKTFIHNAGYLGLRGRNGTLELLQAMDCVKNPIKLVVRSQTPRLQELINKVPQIHGDDRVHTAIGTLPSESLYADGDVFVFPEKFNGLSLPLQEARASGMLVMSTNRYPMNQWLPIAPLIPVAKYNLSCISGRCLEFQEAVVDPRDIARTIDACYDQDIALYSRQGEQWAREMSWESLKPRYLEALSV